MSSVFDDLSSVIFRQSTELPLKFSKLRGWLGWISKHFGLCWQQALQDWTDNLLRYLKLDGVWILGLRECTVELFEATREDHHQCLDM